MGSEAGEKVAAEAVREPAAGEKRITLTDSEEEVEKMVTLTSSDSEGLEFFVSEEAEKMITLTSSEAPELLVPEEAEKMVMLMKSSDSEGSELLVTDEVEKMIPLTTSEDLELLAPEAEVRELLMHEEVEKMFSLTSSVGPELLVPEAEMMITLTSSEGPELVVPDEAEKTITLTSSEGQEFRVSEAAALLSPHLAVKISKGDNVVALRNVPARALDTVVKYCNKHAAANPSAEAGVSTFNAAPPNGDPELDKWDRTLVGGLGDDVDALYDLLIAANFLRIEGLVDAVCETVANIIKRCETPKRIRETFGIPDDLTAEEKENIRNEYAWAFGPDDI